jgi:dsRNA-specific ribonuclease
MKLDTNSMNPRVIEIINSIKDSDNFKAALTHKSYTRIYPSFPSYENLASHGERILDVYILYILNHIKPDITDDKSLLMDEKFLKEVTSDIKLEGYVKIRTKISGPIRAAILKSFIAALYLEKVL